MYDPLTYDQLLENIKAIKAANQFHKFIDFIQFPFYRNLEPDTKITFDFPFTVFVGQNGSGKSSTLHAVQGCPEGYTPYRFWFDTKVDLIQYHDNKNRRHSFFYSFRDDKNNELEVIKARIRRKGNPNYWETSRPLKWAGMKPLSNERERNDPIRKTVVYIDFRAELSAFDKYFYFREPGPNLKSKNKQEYLRRKSSTLKKVIEHPTLIIKWNGISQNKPVTSLTKEELECISYILGRSYISGQVINHKFFEDWGTSVLFQTNQAIYSEAFAGSGEMATVKLVQEVLNAEMYSLIILDEPEVSLHPGAQHRLKMFLLDQMIRKKHQIVLSTHSSILVEGLPKEAIKVFSQNLSTGKFRVISDLTSNEAFYHIQLPNVHKKTIVVEDKLAKSIVKMVIEEMGRETESLFEIIHYPGGESVLKSDFIKVFSQEQTWDKYILFDGDQKLVNNHFDPNKVPNNKLTIQRLKLEIKNQTNSDKILFKPDGGTGDHTQQVIDLMKKYLYYYLSNVFYLPKGMPEEIIWNQGLAERQLQACNKKEVIEEINDETNHKNKFYLLAEALFGDSKEIHATYDMFINYWKENKDTNFNIITEIINKIKN